MRLHSFFRSSASYRVRIALELKGLSYDYVGVAINRGPAVGDNPTFRALNPQGLVPVLEDEGRAITQSLAILEYLEETHPSPALLPAAPWERARVRALALAIACEIHPLNNLRVLKYLEGPLGVSPEARTAWYQHWVRLGFEAIERTLARDGATGRFCHGDAPGLADCFLVPQVANARRFACDLSPFPTITRIDAACAALEPFRRAAPNAQPDAVK
jgi:maleylacetoacetate isomerase